MKHRKRLGWIVGWAGCALLMGGVEERDEAKSFRCDAPQDGAWTSYGRDPASTHCAKVADFVGPREARQLGTAWEFTGLAGATSIPVVRDGVVYFGDWNGALHAVNAATGAQIWSTTIAEGAPLRSTPTIAGDVIYAAWASYLTAYDIATGEPLWVQLVDPQETGYIESSPIVIDDIVVVGIASYELSLDLEDYTFRGSVVALDVATGKERWRHYTTNNNEKSGAGVSVWSSATVDRKRKQIYIGTGNSYEPPAAPESDSLLAINYRNGKLVWKNQFTADDVYTVPDRGPGPDFDVGATPTLFRVRNRDLVAVGSKAGIFKAVDCDTGKTVWAVQLNTGSEIGGIMTSAAYAGGVLFVNSNDWVDYGFLFGENSPNDTSITYAIDAANGKTLWQRAMPAPAFGALSVVNGVVYQGLIDGTVVGLRAQTGEERFRDTLPGPVGGGLSAAEGGLFVSYGFSFFKAEDGISSPSGVRAYR